MFWTTISREYCYHYPNSNLCITVYPNSFIQTINKQYQAHVCFAISINMTMGPFFVLIQKLWHSRISELKWILIGQVCLMNILHPLLSSIVHKKNEMSSIGFGKIEIRYKHNNIIQKPTLSLPNLTKLCFAMYLSHTPSVIDHKKYF